MNDLYPEIFASAHKKKKHKPPQTSAQLSMYVLSEIKKKERRFFLLAVFLSAFSLACIGYGVNILFEDVLSARSDELFAATAVYIVLMTVAYFLLSFGKRLITEKVSFSLSDKISSRAEQTIRQRRCRHVSGFIEFTRLFVSATVYNSAVFSAACVITVFQLIVVFIFSAAWGYVLTGAVALSLIFFVLTEKITRISFPIPRWQNPAKANSTEKSSTTPIPLPLSAMLFPKDTPVFTPLTLSLL